MRHDSRCPPVRLFVFSLLVSCGLVVPAVVATRAADPVITAGWRDTDVTIDGAIADWPRLERVGTGPAVGVRNDDTMLYLAVASNDATVRLQLATGLIVWIDGTARKAQTFGVRLEGLTRRPLPGASPDDGATGVLNRGAVLTRLDAFDLLGPGRNQRRLIDDPAAARVALASGVEDGTIVYELRLPLEKTSATPFAVGAKPGATVSLGFETPADPKAPRRSSGLDDPFNTNPWINDPYYDFFFRPPPPPGGSPRAPKEVEIKPMKVVWAEVRLAAGPARVLSR
jgi:hypothetical protein